MKATVDGTEIDVPERLLEGLAEAIDRADRAGRHAGFERGVAMASRYGVKEVFLLPHSVSGQWALESCIHNGAPWFYVNQESGIGGTHIGVWQSEEDARAAAARGGFIISTESPHAPGTRREHVRPPYPW